ncbi:MAG TPA: GtrA family protein [bacterium]|nr:GtrA family protein [bacterium]
MERLTKIPRPVRFVIVGGWNTVFGYGVYVGLYFALGRWAVTETVRSMAAVTVATAIAVAQAFVSYKYFVFRGSGEVVKEFAKFSVVYLVMFGVNLLALPLLLHFTPLGPVVAQAVIVVGSAAASYLAHTNFSFREKGASAP